MKRNCKSRALVAHACNPNCSGGRDYQMDYSSKPAPGKWFSRPYLEKKKMAGGVAQGAGPEFKSQYLQTNMQNIQSECVHHVLFMQDIKGVYVRASLCQEYSKESTVPEIRDIQKSEGINS
jgi:hypothetical protein